MIRKVKDILGIEGVKIDIQGPDVVIAESDIVEGKIILTTVRDQVVTYLKVNLIEKYARGRKDKRLIDEYVLGTYESNELINVTADAPSEIPFSLKFSRAKSEMDKLQETGLVYKGLISVAKFFKKVKSSYRLEANASVKGTKFNPSVIKDVVLR